MNSPCLSYPKKVGTTREGMSLSHGVPQGLLPSRSCRNLHGVQEYVEREDEFDILPEHQGPGQAASESEADEDVDVFTLDQVRLEIRSVES